MIKRLNLYKTISEFEANKHSLLYPSISYIKEDNEVYLQNLEDYAKNHFLVFTAEEDGSSIGLTKLSTNQILEYSIDTNVTWNLFDTTTTISLNIGDKVYVRGMLSADNVSSNYTQFNMSGKIAAFGNCNAIWNYEDLNTPLKSHCGYYMFKGCSSLTTAPELPATELASYCYKDMFNGCTSLATAPELPATTLANYCYSMMFYECQSLATVPELLPATELADHCYADMFAHCTSLTTVLKLPATTLANYCYSYMFYNCTSLVTAPELPATTLADHCYYNMFNNCTSLNYIKCLATDISATYCTAYWVDWVASTGTFIKHPDMNNWTTGVNGMPEGWVVEDAEIPYVTFTAEEDNSSIGLNKLSTNQTLEYSTDTTTWNTFDTTTNISLNNGDKVYVRGMLSADNTSSNYTQFKMSGKIAASGNCNAIWNYQDLNAPLKAYCGYNMFLSCTRLTTAPKLPAVTLAKWCYGYMFNTCRSLTVPPELPATELAERCYKCMFGGCTTLTTAPELPATTLAPYCYQTMFKNCTTLTTAPELPATTLAPYCYHDMFTSCTALTTAPELPATTLANGCYALMFWKCDSLSTAPKILPATTLAAYCYHQMFCRCTTLVTAPELPAATLAEYCYYYMFASCTSLNYIKCLAIDISAAACTGNWVEGVSSTGTFIEHPAMSNWTTGSSGIPTGWTVENI